MKLSVVTPTHNPKYLGEVAQSLAEQTYKGDWEWVIVPNGDCSPGKVFSAIKDSPVATQVRIVPMPATPGENGEEQKPRIGAIKKFAFSKAVGDVHVELDHDDLLAPECLQTIAETFDVSPEVGCIYSNCAEFWDETWEPHVYPAKAGWLYRDQMYKGHLVKEAVVFDPTPHSLSSILFAPNHVRAWRSSVYEQVGGHEETLPVADDHDLMAKMYLATKMVRIDKLLYLYRLHQANSYKSKQLGPQISFFTEQVKDRYLEAMVMKWSSEVPGLRVDVCCGAQPAVGFLGVDVRHGDVQVDLNGRWPFPDNSISVVRAFDALEHLRDPIHAMQEAYRVLIPGGWLLSLTPSTDGRGAFQDPTHVSYWNENSFWYYTREAQSQYLEDTGVRFQAVRNKTFFPSDYHKEHNISYVRADLVAIKGDYRAPGFVYI